MIRSQSFHLEQPIIPPPRQVPSEGIRGEGQPTGLGRAPRLCGVFDQVGPWIVVRPTRPAPPLQGIIGGIPLDSARFEIKAFYLIDDSDLVTHFIDDNGLRGILLEAQEHLSAIFGNDAIKTLTLVRDDEGFDALFCLIRVTGEMEEAREALRDFDRQWWLARVGQVAGKLNFDFELV